jgi:hypothetical protein
VYCFCYYTYPLSPSIFKYNYTDPWHFHGHYFWVVGRGNGTFNETEDVPKYNLKNPVLRDTSVGLGSGWLAVVRCSQYILLISIENLERLPSLIISHSSSSPFFL